MVVGLRRGLRRYVARAEPEQRAAAEQFAEALLGAQAAFADQLLSALRDRRMDPDVRATAVWLLHQFGDRRFVPTLLRVAQDRRADRRLKFEAVKTLGLLKVRRAVGPLVGLLLDRSEDEWVRRVAAQALGWLRDPAGRDPLFRVVTDPAEPPEVRAEAVDALGNFDDERVVPALLAQLGDPSPEVRFWAVFALGGLGGPEVVPELERVAETDDGVAPGWWSVRREALDAIRSIQARSAPGAQADRVRHWLP
jgi:HEAT repeat protein